MSIRFLIKPNEFSDIKDEFQSINGFQSVGVDRIEGLYLLKFDQSKTNANDVFTAIEDLNPNVKLVENVDNINGAVIGIEGMTCKSCVALITDALLETNGVINAKVSLENKKADVWFDKTSTNSSQLQNAIEASHSGKFKTTVKQTNKL